jgi:diguanylate cyclase (GGDEF)-like protein
VNYVAPFRPDFLLLVLLVFAGGALAIYIRVVRRGRADLRQKVDELLVVKRQLETANAALADANLALEQLSTMDALTGIANRRRLDEAIATELGQAARNRASLAAAMIDIDHFKPYNDHYGHVAGDDCLKKVAGVIQASLERPGDLAARYGGEEFLVLLPNTDLEGAAVIAERIRKGVESLALPHSATWVADCVTVSVGYAAIRPLPGDCPADLVKAADRALYAAKEHGRNRISD